jgi:capsular polysaccharide biosynthesis protein
LPAWESEILSKLGYKDADIIRWKYRGKRIKNLVLPSYPESIYKDFLWLKEKMLAGKKAIRKKDERLYVSRKNYSTRNIINEEELYPVLQKYGFDIIYPENLSATEQALLFSKAEIVVGPNGSGLVNVIYSDSIKVMEIFGSITHFINYTTCLVMGHQYKIFQGKDVVSDTEFYIEDDNIESKDIKRDRNIYVDPKIFKDALEELI